MELIIEHVSNHSKDVTVVDDITLHIAPEVWGLQGANSAGKNTLIRMIAGIMKPAPGKMQL